MSEEDEKSALPDHTLQSAKIEAGDGPPEIYAVSDLRAYVKAGLDEELGSPDGSVTICGTEVLCTCVPVETCVCNTVSYRSGGNLCPGHCPCQCTCTGTGGLYWHPY